MSKKGRFQKPVPGSGWKRVVSALAGIALIVVGVLCVVGFYLDSKLDKITQAQITEQDTSGMDLSHLIGNLEETEPSEYNTPEESTAAPKEAADADYGKSGKIVNILVVGQDSRAGEESKLADSIILFTLNKEDHTLTLTSFLRDSYVKLPQYYRGHTCGWNRINTSYALGYSWYGDGGAMEMLNLTLEGNYGIQVDGNVEISFETFTTIIDMLGGIEIELLGDEFRTIKSYEHIHNARYQWLGLDTFIDLQEGVNLLNGDMALEYARERHVNEADNDINRANRQRIVIEKVVEKCKQMSIPELNAMLDAVLPQIVTNISKDDMKMYIKELLPYIFDIQLVNNQCPAEGTYYGEMKELPDGPGGVLVIDFNKNKEIMKNVCYDND